MNEPAAGGSTTPCSSTIGGRLCMLSAPHAALHYRDDELGELEWDDEWSDQSE